MNSPSELLLLQRCCRPKDTGISSKKSMNELFTGHCTHYVVPSSFLLIEKDHKITWYYTYHSVLKINAWDSGCWGCNYCAKLFSVAGRMGHACGSEARYSVDNSGIQTLDPQHLHASRRHSYQLSYLLLIVWKWTTSKYSSKSGAELSSLNFMPSVNSKAVIFLAIH